MSAKTVYVIVEGATEEKFISHVLAPYLSNLNFIPIIIRTGWNKSTGEAVRGGGSSYQKIKNEIMRAAQYYKADTYCTTMLDLYKFPVKDSPLDQRIQAIHNCNVKVTELEKAFAQDINIDWFFPYVQLHEFEAFLLIEPEKLLNFYPKAQKAIERLRKEIKGKPPEEINESEQTAPSRRIISHIPGYKNNKTSIAPAIAGEIGIDVLRSQCPHFNAWLIKLESI